ncbi:MAG TPA: tryptophan--tRNA ligase [Candidatus Saccharimonadia bacterium]|nr:tryptophan--tRNA ligase [Candidatus Saccharimonadia bacterium]
MKRVVSGVKPTGDVTLGNYVGAMKRWGEMSREAEREHFFFIPNLHALTSRPRSDDLARWTRSAVAWLLACGVDLEHSYIFAQSQVPAHSELTWVLNNYTTVGELNRMTQFKDKAQKLGPEGQLVGLYDYPVMMAADILLYDADEVPVGDDQKQHVELTRDIATRFNNLHGQTFRVPQPTVQAEGARIMDLQDPSRKMSKSDDDLSGCILLMDDNATIERKIKRAVTDSGSQVAAGDDKPALTNLLVIYSVLSGRGVAELEQQYVGRGYGDFKADLANLVVATLEPLRQAHQQLMEAGNDRVDRVLERGHQRASQLAEVKMAEVRQKLGLV